MENLFSTIIPVVVAGAAMWTGTLAYVRYFRDTVKSEINPNRWSWVIWSFATMLEALTYLELSSDWVKSSNFVASGICCIGVTVLVWRRATWETPTRTETISTVASMAALVLWQVYESTFWAHILLVATLPIAFIPTWNSARKNPEYERTSAWALWSISDALTILVIVLRYEQAAELPYALVEFACHAMVWQIVRTKR